MQKLPMSFDWKAAKSGMAGIRPASPMMAAMPSVATLNNGDAKNSGELVLSLMQHIQLQVKTTTDLQGYASCGNNPYAYVMSKFVNPMLMPYLMQHKIDANGILYIAQNLKNDPDNAKFGMQNGVMQQAIQYDDHVEISPAVILKAIVDRCM